VIELRDENARKTITSTELGRNASFQYTFDTVGNFDYKDACYGFAQVRKDVSQVFILELWQQLTRCAHVRDALRS